MNIANLYRKLKQILNDSNTALANRGLDLVANLHEIPSRLGVINRLPYVLNQTILEITADDLLDITTIGDSAFSNCTSLTSVTIPNSVTIIDSDAFYYCSSLRSVIIGDSVTTIGSNAFGGCRINSIVIPDSVTTIGNSAFSNCYNLRDIYLNPTTPPSLIGVNALPNTITIHVPIGSGDSYKSATNWSSYASKIVEDIEKGVRE